MSRNSKIPAPDPQEVERTYGEFASEYAKVRADAAKQTGSTSSESWEQVEQQLEADR